jgi:CO/xanthine dehydrogenase FAD-binding subunit
VRAGIAVGACSAIPQRLAKLEEELVGRPSETVADLVAPEHFEALAPIDDIRGSAAYRCGAARVLVKDLLSQLVPTDRRRAA